MKNIKKIILSVMVAVPLLMSQNAFAGHYHGTSRSNHYHGRSHVHRMHQPRVIHRTVQYRPYYRPHYRPYRPVIAHYHYGFFEPCYDTFHNSGIYWNVGSDGFGIGIQSGW
jgi:hypothetical protein